MSKLFYVAFVAMGCVSFQEELFASDSNSLYKPFNYRAFEARKKGYAIIVPKMIEKMSTIEYLKHVPSWPGYLRFPNPNNQAVVHAEAGFGWGSFCFNNRSELKDISELEFGMARPTLSDISLISRLHGYSLRDYLASPESLQNSSSAPDAGGLASRTWSWIARNAADSSAADPEAADFGTVGSTLAFNFLAYDRYLAFLADKELSFKSKLREPYFIFNYQAALLEHMLTVGIEVPIVYKIQEIDLATELSLAEHAVLSGAGTSGANGTASFVKVRKTLQDFFFSKYGNFRNFYNDLLAQKNIAEDPRTTRFGIGDISLIVNRRINSDYWTLGLLGLAVTVPSAGRSTKRSVWPVELGNGGFWECRLHGALYWKQSCLINPHILGEVKFCFPSRVERRASLLISYDKIGQTSTVDAQGLPLGENLIYGQNSFTNEPESKIPALAATLPKYSNEVEYRKGASLDLRIGNVFEEIFLKDGALDLYCQVHYKFADSAAVKLDSGLFDLTPITDKTDRWSVQIAAAYNYQWLDNIGFELKGTSILFGKNAVRRHSVSLAMQVRF